MWKGWKAGFLAFHAFHTLSFPWPASRPGSSVYSDIDSAMDHAREEVLVLIVVDEWIGDLASIHAHSSFWRKQKASLRTENLLRCVYGTDTLLSDQSMINFRSAKYQRFSSRRNSS